MRIMRRQTYCQLQRLRKLIYIETDGFGGLGVSVLAFGSNPAEAVGFLRAKKSSARLPSEEE